jgi:hypothetical protein
MSRLTPEKQKIILKLLKVLMDAILMPDKA